MPQDEVEIREGKAVLKIPKTDGVFYNPVQEFNRDISIVVINVFFEMYEKDLISKRSKRMKIGKSSLKTTTLNDGESIFTAELNSKIIRPLSIIPQVQQRLLGEFIVLEALAATGLRSIRYAHEIKKAKYIISNDIMYNAVCTIAYNAKINGVGEKIICTQMDASSLLSSLANPAPDRVEVIDLDPYGSAAVFLDSAVKSIADGGLLCVTCTDVATLCGNNSDACFYKYGSFSLRAPFCHEMALRIVLNCIESLANRYQRYIIPLVCLSVDFYVRLFVRIETSAEQAKKSSLKRSNLIYCENCFSYQVYNCISSVNYYNNKIVVGIFDKNKIKPNKAPSNDISICKNCDSQMKMVGPIWSDPIYHPDFVKNCISYSKSNKQLFGTSSRIEGVLTALSDELVDFPFYYSLSDCFSFVRCPNAPMMEIICDLIRLGKKVSKTHAKTNSIKTNASPLEFWDSIKAWVQTKSQNPSSTNVKNIYAQRLLNKPLIFEHNFDIDPSIAKMFKRNIPTYQLNPAPFWGPLSKNQVGVIGINSNLKKRKLNEQM